MYQAKSLSPMIPSFNLPKTTAFFTDLLEFKITRNETSYVILTKDNVMVHLLRAGKDIGEMELYLEVENIEDVWATINDKLDGIKFKAPFDRDYGMREAHIAIPETNALLFIGQVIH